MPKETFRENLDDLFAPRDVMDLMSQRFEVGSGDIIDARGLRCPQPARRLRKALATRVAGSRFALVADDPLARIDIPHAASQLGAAILAQCSVGSDTAFLIETACG